MGYWRIGQGSVEDYYLFRTRQLLLHLRAAPLDVRPSHRRVNLRSVKYRREYAPPGSPPGRIIQASVLGTGGTRVSNQRISADWSAPEPRRVSAASQLSRQAASKGASIPDACATPDAVWRLFSRWPRASPLSNCRVRTCSRTSPPTNGPTALSASPMSSSVSAP